MAADTVEVPPVSEEAVESSEASTDKPDRELTREEMIEEALNCPCIAKMKEGSCGEQFIAAYRCFLQSDEEPKGMDCVQFFTDMQTCIAEHPEEYDFGEDTNEEEATNGVKDLKLGESNIAEDPLPASPLDHQTKESQ